MAPRNRRFIQSLCKWLCIVALCVSVSFLGTYVSSRLKDVHLKPASCKPQVKVAFMKTHKCASSTIENILFRHAYHNQLNVVLPTDGNYLSRTELFSKKVVDESPWSKLNFHVFTLHNRWNYDQVNLVMGPDTKYFTILRDPADLFESLFAYSQLNRLYRMNLTQLIEAIENDSVNSTRRWTGSIGRNQLSWDLGVQPEDFDDETAILHKVVELENQFDLVLITEKAEESLILLQDLLCWPVEAIAHLNLNQRKPEATVQLTERQRGVLKNWLRADYIIYDHFRRRFDLLLNSTDAVAFSRKLEALRAANAQLAERCVDKQVTNDQLNKAFRGFSSKQMGYTVKSVAGCALYALPEHTFLSHFRESLLWRSLGLE